MKWINDQFPVDGENIIFVTGADEVFDGEYDAEKGAYYSRGYGRFDPYVVIGWAHAYDVVRDYWENIR